MALERFCSGAALGKGGYAWLREWTSQMGRTWLWNSLAGQSSLLAVIGENSYGRLEDIDGGSPVTNTSGGPRIPLSHKLGM